MEIGVLAWLLFGIASGIVAMKKGRSGCGWFFLGVLLGPIGLILAFASRSRKEPAEAAAPEPSAPPLKPCLSCGELIPQDAEKCRFCGVKVSGPRITASLPDHWTCPRCNAANPNTSPVCRNCGYSSE
jgi:ribosomal protein L40E